LDGVGVFFGGQHLDVGLVLLEFRKKCDEAVVPDLFLIQKLLHFPQLHAVELRLKSSLDESNFINSPPSSVWDKTKHSVEILLLFNFFLLAKTEIPSRSAIQSKRLWSSLFVVRIIDLPNPFASARVEKTRKNQSVWLHRRRFDPSS
jgi:hypothetical protein